MMLRAEHNGYEFVIEQDPGALGAFLYVFVDGQCVRDELQDNIQMCIRSALEGYGVPTVAWRDKGQSSEE